MPVGLPDRFICCALALCTSIGLAPAHAADLEVEVSGIKMRKGEIRAALFDNARDFAADVEIRATITPSGEVSAGVFTREEDLPHPPLQLVAVPANAATIRLRFTELEPGEYAVALFHDRNSDGKLDAVVDRRTLEPWGVSNDPQPENRPVTFDEAKFMLPAEGKTISIQLH
jgi:uncharacterized protein (DUF2141 family)